MKRYIRTKDGNRFVRLMSGRIFDLENMPDGIWFDGENIKDDEYRDGASVFTNYFVKQANTIEELIELGDLVSVNWTDCENAKYPRKVNGIGDNYINVDNDFYEDEKYEDHTNYITELYTKQGRNYVLVAEKEGEDWRVI